jgi:hypothetical protein
VSNRGEVLCLDARGLANGNDGPFKDEGEHMTPRGTNAPPQVLKPGPLDADILWAVDLKAAVGIWPHDSAHSSILIHGDNPKPQTPNPKPQVSDTFSSRIF